MSNADLFISSHPGLAEALDVDHPTIADLRAKLFSRGSLSEAQAAFAIRTAADARGEMPAGHVAAPTGKLKVRGKVVSSKVKETEFGTAYKMTVEVAADGGVWLLYSTIPAGLLAEVFDRVDCPDGAVRAIPGCEVEISATVEIGERSAYFGFAKRPRAKLLAFPPEKARTAPRWGEDVTPGG